MIRVDGRDAVHDEGKTVAAGIPAHVVQVRVHIKELLAAGFVFQQGPGGAAETGGVPTLRGDIRRFGQPESAPFQQFEFLGFVENGHEFALLLSVVAAHAHALIALAVLLQIPDLERQGFLDAEDIGLLVLDHQGRGRIAEFRGIGAVLGGTHADVIRHHFQVILGQEAGGKQRKGCQ